MTQLTQSQLSIDLHGKRLEEAVRETSLFLERVRRAWSSASTAGLNGRLMVTIITGSGSHSSHGPVLRSAIKRLLDKRGMNYSLQAGRGAYLVDALSGHDLFGPGEAKSTKVVTADQQEFHQLALLKRKRNGASMADNLGSVSVRGQGIPTSMPTHHVSNHTQIAPQAAITASSHRNPLPSAVTEEEQLQTAKRMSKAKSQQKTKELRHLQKMEDHDVQRAVKLSEIDQQICDNKEDEEAELLRRACDESRTVEAERKRLEHEQYESELKRALLQSSSYEETHTEEYLVEQAMRLSVDTLSPEEELLQQVIAASLADESVWQDSTSIAEEEMILQVIRESLQEQEEPDDFDIDEISEAIDRSRHTVDSERGDMSHDAALERVLKESAAEVSHNTGFDILAEVMRLSKEEEKAKQQADQRLEEAALQQVLELSKQQC